MLTNPTCCLTAFSYFVNSSHSFGEAFAGLQKGNKKVAIPSFGGKKMISYVLETHSQTAEEKKCQKC